MFLYDNNLLISANFSSSGLNYCHSRIYIVTLELRIAIQRGPGRARDIVTTRSCSSDGCWRIRTHTEHWLMSLGADQPLPEPWLTALGQTQLMSPRRGEPRGNHQSSRAQREGRRPAVSPSRQIYLCRSVTQRADINGTQWRGEQMGGVSGVSG